MMTGRCRCREPNRKDESKSARGQRRGSPSRAARFERRKVNRSKRPTTNAPVTKKRTTSNLLRLESSPVPSPQLTSQRVSRKFAAVLPKQGWHIFPGIARPLVIWRGTAYLFDIFQQKMHQSIHLAASLSLFLSFSLCLSAFLPLLLSLSSFLSIQSLSSSSFCPDCIFVIALLLNDPGPIEQFYCVVVVLPVRRTEQTHQTCTLLFTITHTHEHTETNTQTHTHTHTRKRALTRSGSNHQVTEVLNKSFVFYSTFFIPSELDQRRLNS